MKKLVLIFGAVMMLFMSCSKEEPEFPDEYRILANVFIADKPAVANIVFLPGDQMAVVASETTLKTFFSTPQANTKLNTSSLSAYFFPGEYIIAVQLTSANTPGREFLYSYKKVTVGPSNTSSTSNMSFDLSIAGLYQPWKEK